MTTTMFKIKVVGDPLKLKKAKKLVNVGYAMKDGIAIYKTLSFTTKEEVETYLKECGVEFETVSKLSAPVAK